MISLHLDAYIQETLDIYKSHPGTKIIRPKITPTQQGNVLTVADVLEMPNKNRQACYRSMVARLSNCGDVGEIRNIIHGRTIGAFLCISHHFII